MSLVGRGGGAMVALLLVELASLAQAQEADPSRQEVAGLLQREPISDDNWATWRKRLEAWIGQHAEHADSAFESAERFMRRKVNDLDELPSSLSNDPLAWYFLGNSFLPRRPPFPAHSPSSFDPRHNPERAECAFRHTVQRAPQLAAGHTQLAFALLLQSGPLGGLEQRKEALSELARAYHLDSSISPFVVQGKAALWQGNFFAAIRFLEQGLQTNPQDVACARLLALCIVNDRRFQGSCCDQLHNLMRRFPDDGPLQVTYVAGLYFDQNPREAACELERARKAGVDPGEVLPLSLIDAIETEGAPGWSEQLGSALAGFTLFYGALMAFMALMGLVFAWLTRGRRVLHLLPDAPTCIIAQDQKLPSRHESRLARLYARTLLVGIFLCYLALPLIVGALLAGTAYLLYLIFLIGKGNVPPKAIFLIAAAGLGGACAILKSLFAFSDKQSIGVLKNTEECPRLYQLVEEVAHRIATVPVDDVYLTPGSSIGVHQEGSGPFGLFGVKRRVLTLGLSTLHFLSTDELRALLAHEYAHFSPTDMLSGRFLHQMDLSLRQAIAGMFRTGGTLSFINPVYWFLVLFYSSYSLLSAGFSRSRELLADRVACILYGSDVFAGALTKLATHGRLLEMTVDHNIQQLLTEGKVIVNVYDAFRDLRAEPLAQEQHQQTRKKLFEHTSTLFASHPTFGERIEAVEGLPRSEYPDRTPALQLFDNVEEVEKELTDFLTGYVHYVQQHQDQDAQAAQS